MFNFLNEKVGSLWKKILDILRTKTYRYSLEPDSYVNRNGRKLNKRLKERKMGEERL